MIPHVVRPLEAWIGPRTPDDARIRSPFSAKWSDTLEVMDRELRHLWAPASMPWVLQVDIDETDFRLDGTLRVRATRRSPAVRVSFESRHGPLTYQCDRFTKWEANVRAIALGLEALRRVERYGIASRGEQYRGFTAIAARPAEMTREVAAGLIAAWAHPDEEERRKACAASLVLGKPDGALAYAFRLAVKRAHPDSGGDNDTMARLNQARDLLTQQQR